MRILIVNVNTTESMTRTIGQQARAAANPGTEIVPLTPRYGPESVEGNYESYLAAVAVMDRVRTFDGPFDSVIQAGFGEHGKEGLLEMLNVPVIDITEAGAHMAHLLGYRYSVITTLDRTIPLIEQRLLLAGLSAHCASVRSSDMSVLDLEKQPQRAVEAIVHQARQAVDDDRAEVLVLGCGGMAGVEEAVQRETGTPVVDGVAAAVKLAEALVSLNLRTSKLRTYAPPRPKNITYWPDH